MTVDSLMQTCEELGIKLALKADDNSRLQVDAPKGALTASLRDALAAHKPELISTLKAKQQAALAAQASTSSDDSETSEAQAPAGSSRKTPEATLILEQTSTINTPQFD